MTNNPRFTQFKINWGSITPIETRNTDIIMERMNDQEIERLQSIIKKLEAENEQLKKELADQTYLFLMGVESEVKNIVK